MEITFKDNNDIRSYVGHIDKRNNKFFASVEVPEGDSLPSVITNMKGFFEGIGTITMMYNQNISVSCHQDNPNISTYIYESDFVICGSIDEDILRIKGMSVYFKENDYFFISDKHTIDFNSEYFKIIQNSIQCTLLDDNIKIEYVRNAGINIDQFGQKIFKNPVYINIHFKENISLNDLFEQLRKIECVFGFVFGRKVHLIDLGILSCDDVEYDVITPSKKLFTDVVVSETPIVDLTSLELLKDILMVYYSDHHVASAINMYYEYLYNDLDSIFEFTSLINTIELVMSSKFYKTKVKDYTLKYNTKLVEDNKIMKEVVDGVKTLEQKELIESFYNYERVGLRDRIKYIFERVFKLTTGTVSDKYISSIINTRNYYVHGTKNGNVLNSANLVSTKHLLRNILYLLIVYSCSNEINFLISSCKELIPVIYKGIVDSYNN